MVRPLGTGFRFLVIAIRAALALSASAFLVLCLADLWLVVQIPGWWSDGAVWIPSWLHRLFVLGTSGYALSNGVCAIAWLIWQYQLAKCAPRSALRRGPGWQVGSWFVPLAFFWMPVQNMLDIWRHYRPGRPQRIVGWWWAMCLLGVFRSGLYGDSPGFAQAQAAGEALKFAAGIAAAVLAIKIVGEISKAASRVDAAVGLTPAEV